MADDDRERLLRYTVSTMWNIMRLCVDPPDSEAWKCPAPGVEQLPAKEPPSMPAQWADEETLYILEHRPAASDAVSPAEVSAGAPTQLEDPQWCGFSPENWHRALALLRAYQLYQQTPKFRERYEGAEETEREDTFWISEVEDIIAKEKRDTF
ncbi:hypothetical protein LTR36_007347 [Oleoguttula mirabilis]|uniref:Uncharacterized protein n=1 Tax=Oleoguttula mirabilis TaxID=1507867 RepID=A0AAV9JA95_9PEZI|nr:hypothetical protein LTR36_007347 [Oleoguttula mirabilis]